MKRSRFTEEQIIGILREHEAGVKTADVCLSFDCEGSWNADNSEADGVSTLGQRRYIVR